MGKMSSPITSRLANPLKGGKKNRQLEKFHEKQLGAAGVRPPKNPLK